MKATGIVRRIDKRGIITSRAVNLYEYWTFRSFCLDEISQNIRYI